MDNPNPIYYADLVKPDKSIENLIGQLQALIDKYGEAKTKIQGEAAAVAKAMENVSSATEEQRKQIQLATEQSDRLVKEYRDVTTNQWKATQAFTEATKAKKEAAQIDKLVTQINTSVEGSYNRLSAQYRLNKIRLNEMSAEMRATDPAAKALEQETAAIYEEMKRLQEATGKHTLSVGDYEIAARGMRKELQSLIAQMAMMKVEGKDNTQEYQQMAQKAGELQDAMMDARQEVQHTAGDTKNLNAVMGALAIGGGGLAVLTKGMGLFGSETDRAQDAEKGLGVVMASVAGLVTIQNNLQKQSNLMVGIGTIKENALTVAKKLGEKITNKQTIATKAATIAQKAFNAVAAANPYVLLAIALTTVVGALVAFALGSNQAAKNQSKLNQSIAAGLDYMDEYAKTMTRANNERADDLQRELDVTKARNASIREQQAIEDKLYAERAAAHNKQMGFYAEELANEDANREKLETLRQTLLRLQQAQASGKRRVYVDVDLDGKVERVKVDAAIDAVQGQIDNIGRTVEISTSLKTEGKDIAKERAAQLAQRKQEAIQAAKAETDILRASEDSRVAIIKDAYTREKTARQLAAQRQIEDIKTQLKNDANLTTKARKALNAQIVNIETQLQKDLATIRNTYAALNLAAVRETEDIRIALMADGAEKEREQLRVSYQRQMNDILTALATESDLTVAQRKEMYQQYLLLGEQYAQESGKLEERITIDQMNKDAERIQMRLESVREGSQEEIDLTIELLKKQRDIELAENKRKAADVRQSESDINKKWDAIILKQTTDMNAKRGMMLLGMQQELAASEFDLLNKNERQKTQFQLQQEKARLQKILELNKAAGVKLTDEQEKTIKNQIKAIENIAGKTPYNNLYELLGINLDDEQQEAMNTIINQTMASINEMLNLWIKEADAAVNAANSKVDSAQRILDAEIEARNNGYANNVVQAQKELELQKRMQQKALEEKKKAQAVQLALDTAMQVSSLVTASANIWSGFTAIQPAPLGLALAIAGLATLWGSFAASKAMAIAQATKAEQYGDGTVELLQGGSHASGNDIDLGTKPDGTRRRAEGGEYFAVINKRNSRKYGAIIPDVINSFNNGTFADKYQRANADIAVAMVGGNGTDISILEQGVEAIRKQGERTRYIDGDGNTVEVYKNLTRKIIKS